jgi:hypothetical protein
MRNVGFFIAGSLASGLIVFMGCGGNGGGGSGGKTTTSTGTHTTSSTGHGGATSSSTTGVGGCAGTGGAGVDGGIKLTGNHCNPVTNMGCASGTSCDYDTDKCTGLTSGFSCTMGATVPVCGDCSGPTAVCGPGTTCFYTDSSMTAAVCARYCCTDADCGSSGKCQTSNATMPFFGPAAPTLGICVLATPPDGGTTGPYVCNPPSTPPSMGSCVTVM